jgi:hypothetical protein
MGVQAHGWLSRVLVPAQPQIPPPSPPQLPVKFRPSVRHVFLKRNVHVEFLLFLLVQTPHFFTPKIIATIWFGFMCQSLCVFFFIIEYV